MRDTKLDRANHESTGKHQSALKRSLRELHRGHEREEREKERAKREVDRLNGVVSGVSSSSAQPWGASRSSGGAYGSTSGSSAKAQPTEAERQQQLEQLADLGVNIPTELRGDMAMAGEWTVTSTRVIRDPEEEKKSDASVPVEARASGVRKREREQTEEEKEEEKAIGGLFKKTKRWGRDTRTMPSDGDAELDALLSGSLVKTKKEESQEEGSSEETGPAVKEEQGAISPNAAAELRSKDPPPIIKQEPDAGDPGSRGQHYEEGEGPAPTVPDSKGDGPAAPEPAVVFKKRKPKNLRQK